MHYLIEPEVAGGFGEGAVVDWTSRPPRPLRADYKIIDWLGDCIVTSTPFFLAVRDTARKFQLLPASGLEVSEATVSEAPEFREINPDGVLPDLVWLRIGLNPGVDDFGLTRQGHLVVSGRVLQILLGDGLKIGEYIAWAPGVETIPGPPPWPPRGIPEV